MMAERLRTLEAPQCHGSDAVDAYLWTHTYVKQTGKIVRLKGLNGLKGLKDLRGRNETLLNRYFRSSLGASSVIRASPNGPSLTLTHTHGPQHNPPLTCNSALQPADSRRVAIAEIQAQLARWLAVFLVSRRIILCEPCARPALLQFRLRHVRGYPFVSHTIPSLTSIALIHSFLRSAIFGAHRWSSR